MSDVATRWRSAARTDAGKVRARNEDAFLDSPEQGLWAVADGMGGHSQGDLASRLIIESLAELPVGAGFDERLQQIRQCLHWLNRRLNQELTVMADQTDTIIGSTVVVLLCEEERAACVWAGDSRCYLWRSGRLYQLTKDHSVRQRMIDEERLTPEQAARHPAAHALTQAIGANETLALDILEFNLMPGDSMLLCSDGLYKGVSQNAIGAALSLPSAQVALERLFDTALLGPARDNLTAIVIRRQE
ncbi:MULTISPECIES: PP2C family protein-serine/threonine phosphatase [Pseudomonas]|uniref:PP2C family protein-serine/threonine phosphatase n=1 Tax=Pseudomonas TaxID=286 RepID=UPI002897D486|nr:MULTISPECIES: serine/threonine-protein phosphatase [Pseudomonas]